MSADPESQLQVALSKEAATEWTMIIYSEELTDPEFVDSHQRDDSVRRLWELTHDLHLRLEVLFRAANLLDSFLSLIKVRHRYLQCVTATCFYIAAKLEEKEEVVSSLPALLVKECDCSLHDLHRMELVITKKLQSRLTGPTPLDMLKMFHNVGTSSGTVSLPRGLAMEQHVCHMALCMETLLTNHILMRFRPSLLALAVLGCDLKLLGCDWLAAVISLQVLAGIQGGELSICYETITPHYSAATLWYPLIVTGSRSSCEDDSKPDGDPSTSSKVSIAGSCDGAGDENSCLSAVLKA